jgi:hypothetical protein
VTGEVRTLTYPDEWLADIEDALAHPEKFRFAGYDELTEPGGIAREQRNIVVPAFLAEQFDLFHSRAISHAVTKGQHEAAALLNFYIVLKYRLWRGGEFHTRLEYIEEVTNQPFSVASSTIDHYCSHIDDLLEQKMPLRLIVNALGMAKGATARVAKMGQEVIPNGNREGLLETISDLSPAEAHRFLDDLEQKDVIAGISANYVEDTSRLVLEVLVTHPMPQGAKDASRDRYYITCLDCPKEVAMWLCEKTHVRATRREFK